MNKVVFVLDQPMLEAIGHGHLAESLSALGYEVHTPVLGNLLEPGSGSVPELDSSSPVVAYGSIRFVRIAAMLLPHAVPGAYYSEDAFRCSRYMHKLPPDLLGNQERIYLPFGDFRRDPIPLRLFGVNSLFIRPDAGSKVFTGTVVDRDDWDRQISTLMHLTSVTDDSLVVCSPEAKVIDEHRFYIVNRQVVAGSRYGFTDDPDNRPICPELQAIAERVAEHAWQIDVAYTCDVGLFDGVPGIVELNAMSTSGLYQCDSVTLFKHIAQAAILEFEGEISRGE